MNLEKSSGAVVALGNFDGLHRGHIKVISEAVKRAEEMNLDAVVLLFEKHPSAVLFGKAPESLMTNDEKEKRIKSMGARCVFIDFCDIMSLSPEEFVGRILIEKLGARALCCGFNYRFGKNAAGNAETLREICERYALSLFVCDKETYKGEPVSSSRIRECIKAGNMTDASNMLGFDFGYESEVVGGDRLGRKLGAPTINQLFPENFAVPLDGVYSSETYIGSEKYLSVTNIGIRPTVNGKERRSETYIIDFSGDLYGKKVEVRLKKYMRSEIRFSNIEELKKQISFDAMSVRTGKQVKLREVKAVFFDFDDTLQSRRGAYRLYCEAFVTKYFPDISAEEREKKLSDMEEHVDGGYKSREEYFPELIELWQWDSHPEMQELYDSFNNDYGKYVVMLPHAVEVLEEIKMRGYTIGIISNGVSVLQNTKLDTAGIREMFDITVVSGDFGVYKPDRRIFDEACRLSGFKNEECLFVGDHPINDIQGALGAGMQVVRMNQGDFYNQKIDNRIATIENLTQLVELL